MAPTWRSRSTSRACSASSWRQPAPTHESECHDRHPARLLQGAAGRPRASLEVITAAYKTLAKRFHPETDLTGVHESGRRAHRAYGVLRDPAARQRYDWNGGSPEPGGPRPGARAGADAGLSPRRGDTPAPTARPMATRWSPAPWSGLTAPTTSAEIRCRLATFVSTSGDTRAGRSTTLPGRIRRTCAGLPATHRACDSGGRSAGSWASRSTTPTRRPDSVGRLGAVSDPQLAEQ